MPTMPGTHQALAYRPRPGHRRFLHAADIRSASSDQIQCRHRGGERSNPLVSRIANEGTAAPQGAAVPKRRAIEQHLPRSALLRYEQDINPS